MEIDKQHANNTNFIESSNNESLIDKIQDDDNDSSSYISRDIRAASFKSLKRLIGNDNITPEEIKRGMLDATWSSWFYACNTIVIKLTKNIAGEHFTPFNFAFWRGLSSTFAWYYIWQRKNEHQEWLNFKNIKTPFWFYIRTFGFFVSFILFASSFFFLRVSTIQVWQSISPVVSLIVSVVVLKEPFYLRYVIGIVLSFWGSAIIVGFEKREDNNTDDSSDSSGMNLDLIIGVTLSLWNVIVNGWTGVAQKVLGDQKMSNQKQVFYVSFFFVLGGFVCSAIMLNYGINMYVIWFGGLNGYFFFLANHYFQEGLKVLNVGGCVPFTYLVNVFVFVLAFVVLKEAIYWTDIIGSLVIVSFHLYNAWNPVNNRS